MPGIIRDDTFDFVEGRRTSRYARLRGKLLQASGHHNPLFLRKSANDGRDFSGGCSVGAPTGPEAGFKLGWSVHALCRGCDQPVDETCVNLGVGWIVQYLIIKSKGGIGRRNLNAPTILSRPLGGSRWT